MKNFHVDYVTPEQQLWIDPTGKIQTALASLRSRTAGRASELLAVSAQEALALYFERYDKLVYPQLDHDSYDYSIEMRGKIGPQGGTLTLQDLKDLCARYYQEVKVRIPSELYAARDYLIARILARLEGGSVQLAPHRFITGTAAGIPTASRKGTFDAETVEADDQGHVLPAYPWYRIQRGKPRAIFVDANANIRKTSPYLSAARNWLKTEFPEYFAAWHRPDILVEPIISRALEKRYVSLEEDYQSMDMFFTWKVVCELILPIYRTLFKGATLMFEAQIEELFTQPLYFGTEMWKGEHSLFSGQNPTNDFETIFTVLVQIAVELLHNFRGWHLALGDDSTHFVPPKHADAAHKSFVELATLCGLRVHDDGVKNRISATNTRFCRRCYSLASPRRGEVLIGSYPSSLAINSIVYPETPNPDLTVEMAACFQRMDNLHGQRDYTLVADWFRKVSKHGRVPLAENLRRDWWERLFGEAWSPKSSITFHYYNDPRAYSSWLEQIYPALPLDRDHIDHLLKA